MTPKVELRAATEEDRGFLMAVYASTREDELARVTGWTAEQKAAFIAQQFAAQDHHYRTYYDGASYDVIVVDGEPAGRLLVARWATEIRIMDIALLASARGRGVGTRLLQSLLAEAAASGRRIVSIHVEKDNPAARLYRRLGFVPVEEVSGVYDRWEAAPQPRGGNIP